MALAFTLPETSGLSFPEIQAMFELYGTPGAPPPWRLHEGRPRQEKKGGLPVEEARLADRPPGALHSAAQRYN